MKTHTKKSKEHPSTIEVTRTGYPVVLVNIALTDTETTFRAMNEILYLLTRPELDNVFRNPTTGKLKTFFAFIVDNGHGEDPDSPLTQMCLTRMLFILNLNKISQRAFAEYHSKRNFVERVHASENLALSRHGAFSSKQVFPEADAGTAEHLQNMEKMASDVKECLSNARFGGHFLQCYRGIKDNGIFDDEDKLKAFMKLSEERKEDCGWSYGPQTINPQFRALIASWGLSTNFNRRYIDDYKIISNTTQC